MGNAIVHSGVGAADAGLLVRFYGETFGWSLRGSPGGGYTMIDTCGGDGINRGIGESQTGEPWSTFYVETNDLQATLDKASALADLSGPDHPGLDRPDLPLATPCPPRRRR